MQQMNLTPQPKKAKKPTFSVTEQDGRFLIVRTLPNTEPLVVDDCRTKAFAEMYCANLNMQSTP